MSEKLKIWETNGNIKNVNTFILSDGELTIKKESISHKHLYLYGFSYIKSFLQEVFLPQGFPNSVHPDYIPYQIWDTVQAFASTILGTLTTHSILQGVGVGESSATPLAAAISWILKDGTGMIGRILFAWWKGSDLDAQSKKWRLVADVLNDIAMGIELALPYFSQSSITILLCTSTSMKSIVGVAGGATRAALTQHQALTNNLADVSAKDGSQETFVNLIASFMGIFILSTFGTSYVREMYLILVAIHIYANYRAVKALRLNSFNEERLALIFRKYILTGMIFNAKTINDEESLSLFINRTKQFCGFNIKLGVSISKLLKSHNAKVIAKIEEIIIPTYRYEPYIIIPDVHKKTIYIILAKHIQSDDIIKAYFEAFFNGIILQSILRRENLFQYTKLRYKELFHSIYQQFENKIMDNGNEKFLGCVIPTITKEFVMKEYQVWYDLLRQSEWNLERNLIPVSEWRANWTTKA